MAARKFSKGEAVRFGWNTAKSNIGFFIGLIIIVALINVVPLLVEGAVGEEAGALALIVSLASWVLDIEVTMGLIRVALRFCDGEKGRLSDLFSCFPLFFKYVFASILYGLISSIGVLLLIIPGIIWSVKYQFFGYFIVDKGVGPVEALKGSSRVTKGAKWDLFVFSILLGLINFLGALCLGVGLLLTIPLAMVAQAFVYRKLLAGTEGVRTPKPVEAVRPPEPLPTISRKVAAEVNMPEEKEKKEETQELEEWKVRFKDGTVFAPVTFDNLLEWYKGGQIDDETPVAKNDLTAQWVPFKETEGFQVVKAQKEGRQVFCISCGAPWPIGTKLCTKCGTFLETGVKIAGAGERKKEEALTLRRKVKAPVSPPKAGDAVALTEAREEAGASQVEGVVSPEAEELVMAPAAEEAVEQVEAPALEEAAEMVEAAAPPKARKRGKKGVLVLLALAVVVVALAVLAPGKMSSVLDKVKSLVGLKGKGPKEAREGPVGVTTPGDRVQSAIDALEQRIASALKAVPFPPQQTDSFSAEVARSLRGGEDEFSDADVFVSLLTALARGDLKKADGILETERKRFGAEGSPPRFDAVQGCVQVLLGKADGATLLASAVEDEEVAEVASSFSRSAMEGCLDRILFPRAKGDWEGVVAEILGIKKEDCGDELLSRHCGRILSGLAMMGALAGALPSTPPKRIPVKSPVGGDLLSQAALVELGKTEPAKADPVLRDKVGRVAHALRLMSGLKEATLSRCVEVADALKEGLKAEPDNAFFNYAMAAVCLRMNRIEDANVEVAAGNKKPGYRDYAVERMEGLAQVLDTPLRRSAAAMTVSFSHLPPIADCSRKLVECAVAWFRVGRRREAFEMLSQWRTAWERIRGETCSFGDAATIISAAVPCMAVEGELHKRDARESETWKVRKAAADSLRLAMAIKYGASYEPSAELFVKEIFSTEEGLKEVAKASTKEILAGLWTKAMKSLEEMEKKGPAGAAVAGANLQDPNYVQAKKALDEKKYDAAFQYASACLTRSPDHIWAFKVMDDAVKSAGAEAELAGPKAVAYMLLRKADMSTPQANRVQYEIQVAKGTAKEEAVSTARVAREGFTRREKLDAVRICVMLEGSRSPFVVLDWAPGGDWEKARAGTPETEFKERVEVSAAPQR
jgi:hypothetical protein